MILLEKKGPIALLTLNRPEMLNAIGQPGDGEAIAAACAEINADLSIRCTVLTGAGRAFSAGGDLKAMRDRTGAFSGAPADLSHMYRTNIQRGVRALYGLETPMIAAVNGAAIGLGCDIACTADMRVASEKARFAATFLKVGLIPGDGGSWLLPRVIGHARAARLLFAAEEIDAKTAQEWGLVSDVYAADDLLPQAMALAEKVAAQPPRALRMAKGLMRQAVTNSLDTILEMSAVSQAVMHHTRDHEEGVAAVLEKRKADFTGE